MKLCLKDVDYSYRRGSILRKKNSVLQTRDKRDKISGMKRVLEVSWAHHLQFIVHVTYVLNLTSLYILHILNNRLVQSNIVLFSQAAIMSLGLLLMFLLYPMFSVLLAQSDIPTTLSTHCREVRRLFPKKKSLIYCKDLELISDAIATPAENQDFIKSVLLPSRNLVQRIETFSLLKCVRKSGLHPLRTRHRTHIDCEENNK